MAELADRIVEMVRDAEWQGIMDINHAAALIGVASEVEKLEALVLDGREEFDALKADVKSINERLDRAATVVRMSMGGGA